MDELGPGKAEEKAENVASGHGVLDGGVVVALSLSKRLERVNKKRRCRQK